MVDQARRDMVKAIVKGAVYVSPVVSTMAAPVKLMAQGPSDMMFMFCDWFPVLCMIFGGSEDPFGSPVAPGTVPPPGQLPAPGTYPAPWDRPPPGAIPPPGSTPKR